MISDDTLMGRSLMTFPVQGTGWFGPEQFYCSETERSRTSCLLKSPEPLFFFFFLWYLNFVHCSQSEASSGTEAYFFHAF